MATNRAEYTSLPRDTSALDQHLEKALTEAMNSNQKSTAAVAMQIQDLQGVTVGDKLWLMSVKDKFSENKQEGQSHRAKSIGLDVWYGICAAIVPILIPFSQTYKDTVMTVMNHKISVGTTISVIAVFCSLIAYCHGSVKSEGASCSIRRGGGPHRSRILRLPCVFLARAGAYAACANDSDRFKLFVQEYTKIRMETSRMNLFKSPAAKDVEKTNAADSEAANKEGNGEKMQGA